MKTLKESYDSKITSDISNVHSLVDSIIEFICQSCGTLSEGIIFDIKVILNELFQNSIRHGNKEDKNKYIRVKAEIVNKSFIYFVIEDEGEGYNYNCINDVCYTDDKNVDLFELKENGRGILIVKNLCERIKFNKKGNKIIILKKLQ